MIIDKVGIDYISLMTVQTVKGTPGDTCSRGGAFLIFRRQVSKTSRARDVCLGGLVMFSAGDLHSPVLGRPTMAMSEDFHWKERERQELSPEGMCESYTVLLLVHQS